MQRMQQIFDICSKHLLSQNQKCHRFDEEGDPQCVYFQGDLMCGAAPVLDKEWVMRNADITIASTPLLRMSIVTLNESFPQAFKKEFRDLNVLEELLLKEIQNIHDSYPTEDWYGELKQIASNHALDTTVLEESK